MTEIRVRPGLRAGFVDQAFFLVFGFWFLVFGFWFLVFGFGLTCGLYEWVCFIVLSCHPWLFSMRVPGTTSHFLKGAKTNEKRLTRLTCPAGACGIF